MHRVYLASLAPALPLGPLTAWSALYLQMYLCVCLCTCSWCRCICICHSALVFVSTSTWLALPLSAWPIDCLECLELHHRRPQVIIHSCDHPIDCLTYPVFVFVFAFLYLYLASPPPASDHPPWVIIYKRSFSQVLPTPVKLLQPVQPVQLGLVLFCECEEVPSNMA